MAERLLKALLNHLVEEDVARDPAVPGAAPPLWLDPDEGVPAPGEGDNATEVGPTAVLGAYITGGIRAKPRESELRDDVVDIHIRTSTSPLAHDLEEQIRAALIDRVNWTMGGLHIGETLQWRPMQRLESGPQGWWYVTGYIFKRRAF